VITVAVVVPGARIKPGMLSERACDIDDYYGLQWNRAVEGK